MTTSASNLRPNVNIDLEGTTAQAEPNCCQQLVETIKTVFQAIVDLLILVWYAIQHAYNWLVTPGFSSRKRVFKNTILCETANHAKFSDLPKYVAARHQPVKLSQNAFNQTRALGLNLDVQKLKPAPYTAGHCLGNVTVFLQTYLKTGDIEKVKKAFNKGSPFMGAVYQKAYKKMYKLKFHPQLVELIDTFLQSYPVASIAEEKEKWLKSPYGDAVIILNGLEAYLKEGKHPKNGDFLGYMTSWIKRHGKITLPPKYTLSLIKVAENHRKSDLRYWHFMLSTFMIAGLRVEHFHHTNCSLTDSLKSLKNLKPGAYKLGIPVYDSSGSEIGGHAIGLIIDKADTCYILDSNYAIAACQQKELTQTMGRLFTEYTGYDYSTTLDGEKPGFWGRINNVFHGRPNLSFPITSGCNLVKVGSLLPRFDTNRVKQQFCS